jgi:hypothetical protein
VAARAFMVSRAFILPTPGPWLIKAREGFVTMSKALQRTNLG